MNRYHICAFVSLTTIAAISACGKGVCPNGTTLSPDDDTLCCDIVAEDAPPCDANAVLCVSDEDCLDGQWCNTNYSSAAADRGLCSQSGSGCGAGQCLPRLADGSTCVTSDQCMSDKCNDMIDAGATVPGTCD